MHVDARGCTCIGRRLKETVLSGTITWSEIVKQNIQAKNGLLINHRFVRQFSNPIGCEAWSHLHL